jgi:hypothetical protein
LRRYTKADWAADDCLDVAQVAARDLNVPQGGSAVPALPRFHAAIGSFVKLSYINPIKNKRQLIHVAKITDFGCFEEVDANGVMQRYWHYICQLADQTQFE